MAIKKRKKKNEIFRRDGLIFYSNFRILDENNSDKNNSNEYGTSTIRFDFSYEDDKKNNKKECRMAIKESISSGFLDNGEEIFTRTLFIKLLSEVEIKFSKGLLLEIIDNYSVFITSMEEAQQIMYPSLEKFQLSKPKIIRFENNFFLIQEGKLL